MLRNVEKCLKCCEMFKMLRNVEKCYKMLRGSIARLRLPACPLPTSLPNKITCMVPLSDGASSLDSVVAVSCNLRQGSLHLLFPQICLGFGQYTSTTRLFSICYLQPTFDPPVLLFVICSVCSSNRWEWPTMKVREREHCKYRVVFYSPPLPLKSYSIEISQTGHPTN